VVILVERSDDPRLADYVELTDHAARRARERDELFVAEGVTAIERLIASGHRVRSVLVTPSAATRLRARVGELEALDAPVYIASRAVLAGTVGFDLHRGAIAAADRRPLPAIAAVAGNATRLAVLEGLNDAENLGAIARSARALGIDGLVLDPRCTDPYSRRTVRVSMGEILHLRVARSRSWPDDLTALAEVGFEVWALTPDAGAEPLWELAVPQRVALLLGAEGPGLSADALRFATRRVRIPIRPDVDSLNVGHAAAIAFAALVR
jgi:tRNA G18 (ribose-2'-O)-methylase SpoU